MENDVLYNRIMNVVHEEYGPPGGEGTKEITITENGTTTEDVRSYAYAEITTAVPNSYTASDEGKVVSNGALVAQGSQTITENGTYDTTLVDDVTVNVSGGGDDTLSDYLTRNLVEYENENITSIPMAYAFSGCTSLVSLKLPNLESTNDNLVNGCTSLKVLVFPKLNAFLGWRVFQQTNNVETIDIYGPSDFNQQVFFQNNKFTTLILRRPTLITLSNLNNFATTPFASGGTGGTLYVPQALISSYQSATNWSTILGYENNSIEAIEGSIYETQYADGTPIPTP